MTPGEAGIRPSTPNPRLESAREPIPSHGNGESFGRDPPLGEDLVEAVACRASQEQGAAVLVYGQLVESAIQHPYVTTVLAGTIRLSHWTPIITSALVRLTDRRSRQADQISRYAGDP